MSGFDEKKAKRIVIKTRQEVLLPFDNLRA